MQNARLDEAQAGIQIVGKNINNLRHADDTTLMAESKEKLKSLLRKVTEESEKVGLKLNILASSSITSWQINGETMKTMTDFIFLGSKSLPRGATPDPRNGCTGPGGPRGAIPLSRSGGAAMRRHPLSKVRSSGCALLEQP